MAVFRFRDAMASCGLTFCALVGVAHADAYDAPANYYSTATGTGLTLKSQLHDIIDGHKVISYDDLRIALQKTDASLTDPTRMVLFYSGTLLNVSAINPNGSIPGWDNGNSWSREHSWPAARQAPTSGQTSGPDYSDLHILRPAGDDNGDRGSSNYGGSGSAPGAFGSFYFPGNLHKGDAARGAFYAAVRYDGSDTNTMNLEVVDGNPTLYRGEMGNKADLLRYHYEDPPDEWERRRNQLIYNGNLSGKGFTGSNVNQNNRNPFIDHPEYVWSIFGDGANDSRLTISAGNPAAGDASTTSTNLTLDPVIVGGTLASKTVTISKAGADPTYFEINTSGSATSSVSGRFNAFPANIGSRGTSIGLNASTAVAGQKTGQVSIDNLDVSSQGAGTGSLDGIDTVNVTANVLDHSNASFAPNFNDDGLTLDFGQVQPGGTIENVSFSIFNLLATSGFTAALDLDSIIATSGDISAFSFDKTAFANLAPDSSSAVDARFVGTETGQFQAIFTLNVSDQDLPGATNGTPLVLTLKAFSVPEPGGLTLWFSAAAAAATLMPIGRRSRTAPACRRGHGRSAALP